jgi:hypothetical protein
MTPPEITDDDTMSEENTIEEREAPNRSRRALFVFGSWILSWAATLYLAQFHDTKIGQIAVDGLTTYMIAVMAAYIIGHSVDRAGIMAKVGERISRTTGA